MLIDHLGRDLISYINTVSDGTLVSFSFVQFCFPFGRKVTVL